MKIAVCVVLKNDKNQFLAVSRKDNYQDFGFPGGKVEENESLMDAAKRETFEETGLIIDNLKIVYQGYDDHSYMATCFLADWSGEIHVQDTKNETGKVQWLEKEYFIHDSSFSKYNEIVFSELEKL